MQSHREHPIDLPRCSVTTTRNVGLGNVLGAVAVFGLVATVSLWAARADAETAPAAVAFSAWLSPPLDRSVATPAETPGGLAVTSAEDRRAALAPTRGRLLAGNLLIAYGAATATSIYLLNVAVSHDSRSAHGLGTTERAFSFIPLVGGALQFAYAGRGYHDEWHGAQCYGLTIGAVVGQAVGLGAVVVGILLRKAALEARAGILGRMTIDVSTYGGTGLGLTVGLR